MKRTWEFSISVTYLSVASSHVLRELQQTGALPGNYRGGIIGLLGSVVGAELRVTVEVEGPITPTGTLGYATEIRKLVESYDGKNLSLHGDFDGKPITLETIASALCGHLRELVSYGVVTVRGLDGSACVPWESF